VTDKTAGGGAAATRPFNLPHGRTAGGHTRRLNAVT